MLVRSRADYYAAAPPTPVDVFLIIEVSDATLDYDRKVKLPLYAAAGIPEVWIAALDDDQVEAYREPVDGRYLERQTFQRGSVLAPLSMPDLLVRCEEILGDVPS